jgi:hypothetical protein
LNLRPLTFTRSKVVRRKTSAGLSVVEAVLIPAIRRPVLFPKSLEPSDEPRGGLFLCGHGHLLRVHGLNLDDAPYARFRRREVTAVTHCQFASGTQASMKHACIDSACANPHSAAQARSALSLKAHRSLPLLALLPAIWWCTRASARTTATARWPTVRWTAATNGVGDHVINRRINVGGAMMLGRGRCREGGDENNCGGKRNFCLAQHFCIS